MTYNDLYLKTKNKEYFEYLLLELFKAPFYKFKELLKLNILKSHFKYFKKLNKYVPPQYILKRAYFLGEVFFVNKSVLIPRFSTETLFNEILCELSLPKKCLELGCGSGALSICLKKRSPKSQFLLVDISRKALKVAKKNAAQKNAELRFLCSDWFSKIKKRQKFDVIYSNPPYVLKNEKLSKFVLKEPKKALFCDDAFSPYQKIIDASLHHLNPGGVLLLEINPLGKEKILSYVKARFSTFKIINDLDGKERIIKIYA